MTVNPGATPTSARRCLATGPSQWPGQTESNLQPFMVVIPPRVFIEGKLLTGTEMICFQPCHRVQEVLEVQTGLTKRLQ